jgi:hypothetical protein
MHSIPTLTELRNRAITTEEDIIALPPDQYSVTIYKLFRAPDELCKKLQKQYRDPNITFYLKFYIPKLWLIGQKKPRPNLIIMLNGLNEIYDTHLKLYDQLGQSFAFRGIASVLFPAPFHLNRTVWTDEDGDSKPIVPTKSLSRRPDAIYRNFQQIVLELDRFLSHIRNPDDSPYATVGDKTFYKLFFSESTKLSLLGYSLGGLMVLVEFLARPELFHKCYLLNSGGTLDDLNPVGMKTDEAWDKIVADIQDERDDIAKDDNIVDSNLISWAFFDKALPKGRFDLEKYAPKLV